MLVGVTVTAASVSLAAPEVAVTGPDGRYRLPGLRAGVYSLTFELPGFRPENRQGIVLAAGDSATVDVRLGLASVAEEQVEVVGVAPVLGTGVLRRRVPANVTILTSRTINERQGRSLTELLNHRLASVTVNDSTTNAFQQDLRFRGFTASPLLGLPQGVAVYQNGVRINEPFGDTVQFDLIPGFALESVQVVPGPNPVYGLNALGGAIGLQLKNGFSFDGARAEISGGAFGRYTATGEFGSSTRNLGVYLGVSGIEERGWRDESDSKLVQLVGDLDYRTRTVRLGTSLIYVDNSLNGNGLAPVELLDVDRTAVYTFPDNTRNDLGFLQTRFDYQAREGLSIQGNAVLPGRLPAHPQRRCGRVRGVLKRVEPARCTGRNALSGRRRSGHCQCSHGLVRHAGRCHRRGGNQSNDDECGGIRGIRAGHRDGVSIRPREFFRRRRRVRLRRHGFRERQ